MAATFLLSQSAANTNLNQAERQLATADRLTGDLGSAVATRQVGKAENIYGQVNTYLGLATTSNSRALTEINDMATQSTNVAETQITQSFAARYRDIQAGINATRFTASGLLNRLNQVRYDEQNNVPVPAVSSASEEVAQAQQARDDDALVQNPPQPLTTFDDDGNEVPVDRQYSNESNNDEPLLLNTADLGDVEGTSVVGGARPVVSATSTQPGQVGPSDDTRDVITTTVGVAGGEPGRPPIAPEFLAPIVAKPNPLAGLASMSYTASIYLMNPEEYKRLLASQQKVLPTKQLLIQSAGIDKQTGSGINQQTGMDIGQRNPWFDVDFYLDDIHIESLIGTQSGAKAHNSTQLSFTVVEPMGITFLNRLRNAVRDHIGTKGSVSELSQNFLMIIRFYGYDSQGNLINGAKLGLREAGSDPSAIVEKWFPFQLGDIRYQITTKATEYKCICTIPQTNVAFSQISASIPFNFELNAPDIQTLLYGKSNITQVTGLQTDQNQSEAETQRLLRTAPPKASTLANVKTYNQGLCEALNAHQQELYDRGKIRIKDVYEIIIDNVPGLKDAKLISPGNPDKSRSAMNTSDSAREKLLTTTARFDKDTKTWSVTAGTQIVQLIDLVIRSSTYITSQQNIVFDQKTGEPIAQSPVKTVQWYRIRSRVEPLGYDDLRNNIAYKITYTVTPYQINDPRSPYFPQSAYRGAHKIYNYWFTGQNSEVLDFKFDINANFVTTFGIDGATVAENRSSGRWFEKKAFQPAPNESIQAGTGYAAMPAANLSERLYSLVDIAKSELTIIGDPDWMQQSEVFYNRSVSLQPFVKDGSVNYDASEVLYEIRFNPVQDYNLSNGLSDVYRNNTYVSPITGERNLPQESSVFCANIVHNYFKGGRFTQKLVGTIREFDSAVRNQQAATAGTGTGQNAPTASQADVRRVDNEIAARNAAANTTGTVPYNPPYSDPYGTSDAQAIIDATAGGFTGAPTGIGIGQVSTPVPKPGTRVVSDDAASEISPFQVGP